MREKPEEQDPSELLDQPIELPITDVLDLHSFRPSEVPDLVRDYLDAAYEPLPPDYSLGGVPCAVLRRRDGVG